MKKSFLIPFILSLLFFVPLALDAQMRYNFRLPINMNRNFLRNNYLPMLNNRINTLKNYENSILKNTNLLNMPNTKNYLNELTNIRKEWENKYDILKKSDITLENSELFKKIYFTCVPQLIRKNLDEAKSLLLATMLKVGNIEKECSNDVPAGRIISQSIQPGNVALYNTKVDLVVSSGPCISYLPLPNPQDLFDNEIPSLSPFLKGEDLEKRMLAKMLEICSATVPNVVGKSLISASEDLSSNLLRIKWIITASGQGVSYESVSITQKNSKVIGQVPKAGETVPCLSEVTLYINQ